jgi:hypothetical protein
MAAKTPLTLMKEKFGEKAQLVAAIEKLAGEELWVSRTNSAKGLAHVSNAKLLRLHATFTEVKAKFGTRDKLIDAILEFEVRTKDMDFRKRLSAWPVPRLFDTYKSAAKRHGATPSSVKAPGTKPATPKPAAPPKAPRKAAGKKA